MDLSGAQAEMGSVAGPSTMNVALLLEPCDSKTQMLKLFTVGMEWWLCGAYADP